MALRSTVHTPCSSPTHCALLPCSGLYKILFTSSRFCTDQSSCHSFGPPVLPPHVCNTIARLLLYTIYAPLLDLPFVCHTQYNIGNNNIV